jgi:phage-related protein
MDKDSCVIYIGPKFTLEWYFDSKGNSDVYDYFIETDDVQKRKFLMLVKRIGDFGKIMDKTKFRNEHDGIFAFKPQPDRYLCFFTHEQKIIVTNAFYKKTDKLPEKEKRLALDRMNDYIARDGGE